ncbi:MAG: MBL fold metallo-hydrolase [Eggerthellaceae bacterium]|nr:MBL fold metallo-hydrolase [Eggerthellaceae bacterium]
MKITVLLENATTSDRFCSKHGLSMFIETDAGRILFDMGPDASFIDNARALGVDVTSADFAILSHGHYDHGGGLRAFIEETEAVGRKVPIYAHERAFESHCANTPIGLKDIGVDPTLLDEYCDRFILTGDSLEVAEGLDLFASVEPVELAPRSNKVLLERVDGAVEKSESLDDYTPDAFEHEQTLLIREGDRVTLVTGCSHCGIVNIMKKAEALIGGPLHAVVAGFHLMNPSSGEVEDPKTVKAVAQFMAERPTRYYTFHCTGLNAYSLLRDTLGERVNYLYTSSRIEL